jgi:hypothetical protein
MYIDPPYGITFTSNFQPEIGRRDVNPLSLFHHPGSAALQALRKETRPEI